MKERVRAGRLPRERVALAAYCGHPLAREALGPEAPAAPTEPWTWLRGVRELGYESWLLVTSLIVGELAPHAPDDAREASRAVVEAARAVALGAPRRPLEAEEAAIREALRGSPGLGDREVCVAALRLLRDYRAPEVWGRGVVVFTTENAASARALVAELREAGAEAALQAQGSEHEVVLFDAGRNRTEGPRPAALIFRAGMPLEGPHTVRGRAELLRVVGLVSRVTWNVPLSAWSMNRGREGFLETVTRLVNEALGPELAPTAATD